MRCALENWHLEPKKRRWMEDDVNKIKFCFSIGWFVRFQPLIQRYPKTTSPSLADMPQVFEADQQDETASDQEEGWNHRVTPISEDSASGEWSANINCSAWRTPKMWGKVCSLHQNFLSNLFGRKWFCWKCWGNKRLSLSQTEADQWHGRLTGNIERKAKKSQGKGVMPFEMWNARAFDLGMFIKIGGVTSDRIKWALQQARPQHFATLSLAQAWSSNIATTVSWRSVPVPLEILKVEAS